MRELTIEEKETINGGWSWYTMGGDLMKAGAVCDAVGGAVAGLCPEAGAAAASTGTELTLAGAACYGIGWIESWF